MTLNDPIANAFSKMEMYEKLGRKEVEIGPISNLLKNILTIMNERGYIGSLEITDEVKANGKVNLIGKLNKCGVIKPRFPCDQGDYEKFEKRFLPAKDFGIMFISTSQGLMAHTEAKEKNIGGKLIAYCY